ncbi:MAG: nucleotide exchange factor GrpE [Planctomycetes bacterium]|nr:nucleotide exchange factor GrpE [Planctomycetota bacterium]
MNDTGNDHDPKAPNPTGSNEPTTEIPTPDQELARLQNERNQLEQQLQRQLADAANMRRRARQEMDDQKRRVVEGLAQELLPALDSFGMAIAAFDGGNTDPKALVEGVRMTRMLLQSALERHGLQEIAATGVAFDPARHEAVGVEPSTTVAEGQILRVLQTGYQIGDRVVRHSRVVVAGPAPKS